MLKEFSKLNEKGKSVAVNRVTELTYIPQYTDNNPSMPKKKERYVPTEEDIRSLVARNGKKMTREEAIEFITEMYSDDDEKSKRWFYGLQHNKINSLRGISKM